MAAVVASSPGHELQVRALLHDGPALHEHDVVRVLHRPQLMGHHQQGHTLPPQLPRHLAHTRTHTHTATDTHTHTHTRRLRT